MKLNRLQRHTAYIILLCLIESENQEFICNASHFYFGIKVYEMDGSLKEMYPELMKRKPKNAGHSWFNNSDYEKNKTGRIRLLKQCIKETA